MGGCGYKPCRASCSAGIGSGCGPSIKETCASVVPEGNKNVGLVSHCLDCLHSFVTHYSCPPPSCMILWQIPLCYCVTLAINCYPTKTRAHSLHSFVAHNPCPPPIRMIMCLSPLCCYFTLVTNCNHMKARAPQRGGRRSSTLWEEDEPSCACVQWLMYPCKDRNPPSQPGHMKRM